MSEKNYVNHQCFRLVKSEKKTGGTILCEVTLNMIGKSFEDSNAFLDSKVIINIQNSDNQNKKISSIPFFFSIPQIYELANKVQDGSISKAIALTKLDKLAEERIGTGNDDFFHQYAEVREEVLKLPPALDIAEVKNFLLSNRYSKMPYFVSIVPTYMGGTIPERAKRSDGKAQARVFEICPGSVSDVILVGKTGSGKVNDKTGGIVIEKVENTLRFPMSYSEFSQMILTVKESVNIMLNKIDIY